MSKSPISISLAIVGAEGVGKSSFIRRHKTGQFYNQALQSIPNKITSLIFNMSVGEVEFRVTESRKLPENCPSVLMLMCDKTKPNTLQNITHLLEQMQQQYESMPHIIFCGNKVDHRDANVDKEYSKQVQQIIMDYGATYYDISSKSNYNYDKPFSFAATKVLGKNVSFVDY